MKKRRWLATLVVTTIVVTTYVWLQQPALRIAPNSLGLRYIPGHLINTKPKVDLLVLGVKLQYPKGFKMDFVSRRHRGWAGALDAQSACQGSWVIGNTMFDVETIPTVMTQTGSGISMIDRTALAVPYALSEDARKAHLLIKTWKNGRSGADRVEVELPLAPAHTKPKLETTSMTAGPWTIQAMPNQWKATTAPVEFQVEVKGSPDSELLIDYDWIHNSMIGYNPLRKCGIRATSNSPFKLTVNARINNDFEGTIHEVEAVPIEIAFRPHPTNGRVLCAFVGERCILAGWRMPSVEPSALGMKVFRIGDDFFGNATANYRREPNEVGETTGHLDTARFRAGQVVRGFGYKVRRSYPFKLKLIRPVTKEMLGFGTQPK